MAAVVPGLNFPGLGAGDYGFTPNTAPPDANGAVGATQYVQWVNTSLAVFDKNTGALILGPIPGNAPWQGFGGSCETTDDGGVIVLYDKLASRWVLAKRAVTGGPPYLECVAVSQTADANGAYFRYAFSYGANQPVAPKLAVWPDAYYSATDVVGSKGIGSIACA